MNEHQCVNCGMVLPPTGTYCLGCDTPVENAVRGLSVGDTQVVTNGRPLVAISLIAVAVVALGGIFLAIHLVMKSDPAGDAGKAAVGGTQYLIHAEGGHRGACPYAAADIAGAHKQMLDDCYALVGTSAGVRIKGLHATRTTLHGSTGTVELRGTWIARSGADQTFRRTVSVDDTNGDWAMVWDGRVVSPG